MTAISAVRVTNLIDGMALLQDGHDGVNYTFEHGRPLVIPIEAAKHMLGFSAETGRADFHYVSIRWGWNTMEKFPKARGWFDQLLVEPVQLRQVELPPGVSEDTLDQAIQLAAASEPAISAGM